MSKINDLKTLTDIMNNKTITDKRLILLLIETLDTIAGEVLGCPKCDTLKKGVKLILNRNNEGTFENQKIKEIKLLKTFLKNKETELLETLSEYDKTKKNINPYKILYKICFDSLENISNGKRWCE